MWTLSLLTILYGHIDNKQKYKKKKTTGKICHKLYTTT